MRVSTAGLRDDSDSLRAAGRRYLRRSLALADEIGARAPDPPKEGTLDINAYPEEDDFTLYSKLADVASDPQKLREKDARAAEVARREYIAWEKTFPKLKDQFEKVRLKFWKIYFAQVGGWKNYEADRNTVGMPVPLLSGLWTWCKLRTARAAYTSTSDSILAQLAKLRNTIDALKAINAGEVSSSSTGDEMSPVATKRRGQRLALEAEVSKLLTTDNALQESWSAVSARIPHYYRGKSSKTYLLQTATLADPKGDEFRLFGNSEDDPSEGDSSVLPGTDTDIVKLEKATTDASNLVRASTQMLEGYMKNDTEFANVIRTGWRWLRSERMPKRRPEKTRMH